MGDTVKFIETIKKVALSAVKATKPTEIMYGTVKQINPLKVELNQKLILEENDLILTDNVIDFETEITAVEKLTAIVHNSLKSGDKVILLRVQGGQQFIVLNKVR